eukprot:GHVR01073955.1.p2 GENE.GHVR01073955.1~~GHVR01073955.1.p2  ORF type:complete len:150 (+),score=69.88 GHVR01073955.1:403-852(+)
MHQRTTLIPRWYIYTHTDTHTYAHIHIHTHTHTRLSVFVMQKNGQARLDFIQNMEYKFVELLSCDFAASVEDTVREQITFRYNSIKNKLQMMQTRMQDINALVKVKNPSLLLQLQRGQQAQQQGGSNTHTHTHTQGQSGSKLAAASHKR